MTKQITPWSKKNVKAYGQYDYSELGLIHPQIIDMLRPLAGKRVADYGCGEGKLLEELKQEGTDISGYDISPEMISKAKARLGKGQNLRVIQSGNIPVADNSLDAVVSNLVLMMCPALREIEQIFREINRVLKPNGAWVYCVTHPAFVDRDFPTYRNIFKGIRDYFKIGEPYQFVLKKENGCEITDPSFIDHNYSLSSYLNLLPRTGFEFQELKEIKIPGVKVSPYMIVRSSRK